MDERYDVALIVAQKQKVRSSVIPLSQRVRFLHAKSSLSTQATFKPRNLASRAAPAPVAPPPMIRTSYSSPDWSSFNIADLAGIFNVSLTVLKLRSNLNARSFLCVRVRDERGNPFKIMLYCKRIGDCMKWLSFQSQMLTLLCSVFEQERIFVKVMTDNFGR